MRSLGDFKLEGAMIRYSDFVPRLYNFCKAKGFEPGKIMPSRAFCSDENQGFPIILITKHFGTFPFNHGQVGGIVSTERNAPHAHHGQYMVIIQASHVGYDPESRRFGHYRRLQTEGNGCTSACGKIHSVLSWYRNEYHFVQENVQLESDAEGHLVTIDNQLLRDDRESGLFLHLDQMLLADERGAFQSLRNLSTSKVFRASETFSNKLKAAGVNKKRHIGSLLTMDYFHFLRVLPDKKLEGSNHLECNLIPYMNDIITSPEPDLTAAIVNTQVEFDRAFRSFAKEPEYGGKEVLFISGLHIDISPRLDQIFPLTKFVPWAAYLQHADGSYEAFEQQELLDMLMQQSMENPDQIELETAIEQMRAEEEVRIDADGAGYR